MARRSKLSVAQWDEIEKRLLRGESKRAIAKDITERGIPITEGAIRQKFGDRVEIGKQLANQIVAADAKLKSLPMSTQVNINSLIDELKAVSMHLASAAKYNAATAHRMAAIANAQAEKIDDANPMGDEDALKAVAGLTRMANDASQIPVALLNANKERVAIMQDSAPKPKSIDPSKLSKAALLELMSARDRSH